MMPKKFIKTFVQIFDIDAYVSDFGTNNNKEQLTKEGIFRVVYIYSTRITSRYLFF